MCGHFSFDLQLLLFFVMNEFEHFFLLYTLIVHDGFSTSLSILKF